MATVLAAQLAQIATKSSNPLDLKAQKKAHSKSLLFEPHIAASQDFDTLYQICLEGFEDLCQMDGRFLSFARSIFGTQSKVEDRTRMTAIQNEELDRVLEAFMSLVAPRLLLKPALKAVEWLIRRFRVHEHNTECLIFSFLPYHTMPVFATLLSIIPKNLPPVFRFLQPYVESLVSPPRHVVVKTATMNPAFLTNWSNSVLKSCRYGHQYHVMTSYWATISTEAIMGQLDQNAAGRKEARRQKEEDILLRILPILNEGLAMRKVPEMRVGCYMILTVLASKTDLQDNVLVAMMTAVVGSRTKDTTHAELICLSVLAQRRQVSKLPKTTYRALLTSDTLEEDLVTLSTQYEVGNLTLGLVLGVLKDLGKHDDTFRLGLIASFAEKGLLSDIQLTAAVTATLEAADNDEASLDHDVRGQLASLLLRLIDSEAVGTVVKKAIEESPFDIRKLEMKLQTVLQLSKDHQILAAPGDIFMEDAAISTEGEEFFQSVKDQIPTRTAYEISFLSHSESYVYGSLYNAFVLAASIRDNLQEFSNLPILRKSLASTDPIFLSFFARLWCGPHPSGPRSEAIHCVRNYLVENAIMADPQVLLPFVLYGLADQSVNVRRAAADLVIVLSRLYDRLSTESQAIPILGQENIYGERQRTSQIEWLSLKDCKSFCGDVLVPSLEECRLDATYLSQVLSKTLGGAHTQKPLNPVSKELKTSTRTALLAFIGSHVVNMPCLSVKLRLIANVTEIEKVGSTSKSKVLTPLLLEFEGLDERAIREYCSREQLDETRACSDLVKIVSAVDREGVKVLHRIISFQGSTASKFLRKAALGRIRTIWPAMKPESRILSAQVLLILANSSDSLSGEAMETIRQVKLPTDVLQVLLNDLPSMNPDLKGGPTASKRRRLSHGHVDGEESEGFNQAARDSLRKTTIVLELVESAKQGTSPDLVGSLFHILANIHHAKGNIAVDLSYAQTLIFSCLYESLEAARIKKTTVDRHIIRADLVVDCFRTSTNTQVHQSSLLLMSSLASSVPDLIVHSVMPIFTFIGSTLLRQSDDYSAHVIDKTIESVIPPLIAAFRKDQRGPLIGVSELLHSFVAAFDHIPVHRRQDLFSALIDRLGAEEFLSALLTILMDRHEDEKVSTKFSIELCSRYNSVVQMKTLDHCLQTVVDSLKSKPSPSSRILLTSQDGHLRTNSSGSMLSLILHLIKGPRLVSDIAKVLSRGTSNAASLRTTYAHLIEQVLQLSEQVKTSKKLYPLCDLVLDALLNLLSLDESIISLEHLLKVGNDNVRRRVLMSLEKRIRSLQSGSQISRRACLNFVPKLSSILASSDDMVLRQTALACIDCIAEKFGKNSMEEMAAFANQVSGEYGLGAKEIELRVMALICLTTLVEVLGDAIVPVIPQTVPMALAHLEETLKQEKVNESLYNAAYSFFSAMFLYVPWMMTGNYLDRFLKVSHSFAGLELSFKCDENRRSTFELVAKQVGPQECFQAISRTWPNAVTEDTDAIEEHLGLLQMAIERQPKSVIIKHSQLLARLFLEILDLRHMESIAIESTYDEEDLDKIERLTSGIMVKLIYKLNDTHFRPIFTNILDWANEASSKKAKGGRVARQTSLYAFLNKFFETLKSIVTSYGRFIVDNAVDVMQTSSPFDPKSSILWSRVIATLQSLFEHDQDDFWQSPSRFTLISTPLLAQLAHGASPLVATALIPCITAFATAADSSDNLKAINAGILAHMRSDVAGVRLAAIKCEISLTETLGEEWLGLLPEMLPFISEAMEDDEEVVEAEVRKWVRGIEEILGESLNSMLQ